MVNPVTVVVVVPQPNCVNVPAHVPLKMATSGLVKADSRELIVAV